jgi:hypothetical protein
MWGHTDVRLAFGAGSEMAVESVRGPVDRDQAKGEGCDITQSNSHPTGAQLGPLPRNGYIERCTLRGKRPPIGGLLPDRQANGIRPV